MKRWLPGTLLLLVAVLLIAWWNAPARVVERRTRALLEVISVPASSGKPARLIRPNSLAPFLSPSILFHTPAAEANGELSADDVLAGFAHIASAATETSFTLVDVDSVTAADDKATIRFQLDVFTSLQGRESANGRHQATIDWHKVDDQWRVTAVQLNPGGV